MEVVDTHHDNSDNNDKQVALVNDSTNEMSTLVESPTIDMLINGASNLKTLLYIWKAMSDTFVFNFTRKDIYSTANNRNNTIIIGLNIPENKLIKYLFDVNQLIDPNETPTQEELDQICIIGAIPTNDLESKLRSCGKAASFTLTIWPNDSNLYFKQTGVDSTSFIPMKLCNIKQYNPPDMPDNTIVRIMTSEFVAAIKSAIADKADKFNFIPFVDGLQIITVGSVGQTIGHTPFGNCTTKFEQTTTSAYSNSKDSELKQIIQRNTVARKSTTKPNKRIVVRNSNAQHMVTIDTSEIKSLSRLGSVSPESSIILVYYNPVERALMLEGLVGTFGTYRIYLRNKKLSNVRLNGDFD